MSIYNSEVCHQNFHIQTLNFRHKQRLEFKLTVKESKIENRNQGLVYLFISYTFVALLM